MAADRVIVYCNPFRVMTVPSLLIEAGRILERTGITDVEIWGGAPRALPALSFGCMADAVAFKMACPVETFDHEEYERRANMPDAAELMVKLQALRNNPVVAAPEPPKSWLRKLLVWRRGR